MRRDRIESGTEQSTAAGACRLLTSLTLLGLAVGVAMLSGPARAADDAPAAAAAAKNPAAAQHASVPFVPPYVRDGTVALIAFRPAASHRRRGTLRRTLSFPWMKEGLLFIEEEFQVDPSTPGFLKLGFEDVDWVTCGFSIGPGEADGEGVLGRSQFRGVTIHTVARFDWLTFLRQFHLESTEVEVAGKSYYKMRGPLRKAFWDLDVCAYLLDDRTLILDEEKAIRTLLSRETPPPPACFHGPEWERASRGLLAIAIDNRNGVLIKQYDTGRPDDAMVLSLGEGVDHWIFGVDDADALALHAHASCRTGGESETIAQMIQSLVRPLQDDFKNLLLSEPAPGDAERGDEIIYRMSKRLVTNLHIDRADLSIDVHTEDFGTFDDLAEMLQDDIDGGMIQVQFESN